MASIDFDAVDYIDEITTRELAEELSRRKDNAHHLDEISSHWRSWVYLAELIAEGRKSEALDLLAMLSPFEINPSTVTSLTQMRLGVYHA